MKPIQWDGKQIKKPGWYSGIPLEMYHSAKICDGYAVSSSDLRTCWSKSAAHMYVKWAENPKREERKSTRSMILGAAAHHLLLGEDKFRFKFAAQPLTYRDKTTAREKPWHNGADYCKAWNAKQAGAGKVPVTQDELRAIVEMARSLALEPLVQEGLLRGYVETSGFVRDAETGLWIKVRPDVVPTLTGDYVDLKTAADVTTVALQSSIRTYGYHQQGALIWEVVEQLNIRNGDAHPFESFVLMFIETDLPYCARTVPLVDDDLARGRLQNRAMLRKIASCLKSGRFPGPGEGDLRALPLADAERERIDKRLEFEKVQV